MAVTSVTVTPRYTRNGDIINHGVLGLLDPLGFRVDVAGTGLAAPLMAVATFTNPQGQVIHSETLSLTVTSATAASKEVDWQTLGEQWTRRLHTSWNSGVWNTTTHVNDPAHSTISVACDGATGSAMIEVVLITPYSVRNAYFPGIPDQAEDSATGQAVQIINDAGIWAKIYAAVSSFEAMTRTFLRKQVISSEGYAATYGYDRLEPGVDADAHQMLQDMLVQLPYGRVLDTCLLRGQWQNQVVYNIPTSWRLNTVDRWAGVVQHVPDASNALLAYPYLNYVWPSLVVKNSRYIENFWHFWYTSGWDELHAPIPAHWIDYCMLDAAIRLYPQWWMGLTLGQTSDSLGADGLSRSRGRSDPANTQLVRMWQERLKDEWTRIRYENYTGQIGAI